MAGSEAKGSAAAGRAENEFIVMRSFDAPRNLVFKAWTEAERLAKWWGPQGFTWVSGKLDLRPGGMFHYCMRSQSGPEMWGKFVYREVVRPERLVFVSSFSDESGGTARAPFNPNWPLEILNTLTLSEHEGKTTLTLRGYPTGATEAERKAFEDASKSMEQGFGGTLDQLAQYLRTDERAGFKTGFVAEAGKPTIVITRKFDAPRRIVFDAWTKPEHLQRWMLGPRGWTMAVCESDFRVGGKWRRVWRHENGDEMEMRGEHREITPLEKVVDTESWGGDWPETVNTLVLTEAGGKTTATLTMQYPSVEVRDKALKSGMKEGMEETFNRLELLLERKFRVAPDLLITRIFDAPRERVFAAWSSAEQVEKWFGPKYFTVTNRVVEFRAGGAFRFVLRGPDRKDYPFGGEYIEIREPERIVFKGTIHDELGHEVLTAVTFADHDGKTRVSVHQSYNFESDATRGAAEGWGQTLDRLREYLARV